MTEIKLNEAQQVYSMMGVQLYGGTSSGKKFSATKTGPGRVHKNGYPSFKTRQRYERYRAMMEQLEKAKEMQVLQDKNNQL